MPYIHVEIYIGRCYKNAGASNASQLGTTCEDINSRGLKNGKRQGLQRRPGRILRIHRGGNET